MGLASRAFRIGKGEGRDVSLLIGLMFISNAAFTIGESGINALFFERVGPDALPTTYLLQGGFTFAAMFPLTAIFGRSEPRRAYLAAPLVLATIVIGERALLISAGDWIYRLLWITTGLGLLVGGVYLWGIAGAVFDTRQAKRLFPILAAGFILGAVAGGIVTRPLAAAIGAENLLFVWAGGLAVAVVLARAALGRRTTPSRRRNARKRSSALRDMADGLRFVRRSSLLRWMTAASVLFSVLFFLLYLPYARAASERFKDVDELAGFFGLFWAGVTGAAFLISMFGTNRIFGYFGIAVTVVVLPMMYSTAFAILIGVSGFVILVALRFTISVWLQGVSSIAWETLNNVVPESRRDQTRAFLSGGPAQIGVVIAGVVALVGQEILSREALAAIGFVVAALTIVAAIGIRRSYADALVDALLAGRPQVFEASPTPGTPVPQAVDADLVRVLIAALRSTDIPVRRLVFHLLADLPPQARPVDVAIGLEDTDEVVRFWAVCGLDVSSVDARGRLVEMIRDADPAVAAAAAARSLSVIDEPAPRARLVELLSHADAGVRRAAADQLRLAPPEHASALAEGLLQDPVPEIRAIALESIAISTPQEALQPALAALHDPDPEVRIAAGRALGATGASAVGPVLSALEDPYTADAAAEAAKLIAADGAADGVRGFARSMTSRATQDSDLSASIPSDRQETLLLADALLERGRRFARSALWAELMLTERREVMEIAIENLDGSPRQLANALETLEVVADRAVVRPLMALWERSSTPSSGVDRDWLTRSLEDEDPFIRRCAELVRARQEGVAMHGAVTSVSIIERILLLMQVSLFADLDPSDLERVARVAEERGYADGEVIAAQGDLGDELHIVVDGTVRVVQDQSGSEHELARRQTGDVVAELAIITQEPRIASLIAEGSVRTIRIGHREFESMLRERPRVGLAVMRELAHRLAERTVPVG